MDKLGVIIEALQLGQEIELAGQPLRLFRAGQVVLLPSGFLELDEDRLMRRLRRVTLKGMDTPVYMDGDASFNWLANAANALDSAQINRLSAESARRRWVQLHPHAAPTPPKGGGRVIALAAVRG